jgi:Asp-tRNA(Asn)/Glu-tRNA(Gln) amidotransferase A subunit family amidase
VSKKWYNYFVVTTPTDASSADTSPADAARPPRAADLVQDAEGDATFTEPVAAPADSVDLAALYRSAKIETPAHGYTVLKVAEMLQSEHIRALPAEVKQKSIMVALDAAGVKVSDIVEDAVQRDRALDTYERVLQQHLENLRAQKELENKQLEDEVNQRVSELRARIAQNRAETDKEQQDLDAWRARKRQEEGRIAEAIGYFVSPNPITVTTSPSDGRTSNASEPRERSGARGPRE